MKLREVDIAVVKFSRTMELIQMFKDNNQTIIPEVQKNILDGLNEDMVTCMNECNKVIQSYKDNNEN